MYHVKKIGSDNYMLYREGFADEISPDDQLPSGQRKRRILIVDDSPLDMDILSNLFSADYTVEKAKDGSAALIRLRHCGTAISVVLLDLMMAGIDGFAVLEKMQTSSALRSIPVIVVSAMGDHETCLKALTLGAVDFVTKPVDADMLQIRVRAAINKAENERLRAQSSLLEQRSNEVQRYQTVLEKNGILVIEHDWISGAFVYDRRMGDYLDGLYDKRVLWRILLSDMVCDTATVQRMQRLVHDLAEDRQQTEGYLPVRLKTPGKRHHWFALHVYKCTNEFGLARKMILTLRDLGSEKPKASEVPAK